jgi:hypothetical protein
MFARARAAFGAVVVSTLLAACSQDAVSPTGPSAYHPLFQGGSSTDTSATSGGGGGGGGGGGVYASCGVLSATISTYNIVVYTTRIGIGFSGSAYNCGSKNAAFEVDVVDVETDPFCHVDVPHFIAAKNTSPAATVYWSANSTLVNCQNRTHTFNLYLIDTKTGQTVDTKTVSAFL